MVKTALVVEDDSGIASLVKDALEAAGFQVAVEKDGDTALAALARRLPDVLITDLLLPTVPGFELLEKLRAMPGGGEVPAIVMSGIYKSARHKRIARDTHQVIASFDKPFNVAELVATAKSATGVVPAKKKTPPSAAIPGRKPKARASDDDHLADLEQRMEKVDVEKLDATFPAERSVRGNLKHKRFPEVLAQLYRVKASGGLLLRRGRIKKIVYLKDGYPTFVKSNLLSECLGRILVREKMISEEECERSLELLPRSNGKMQGTVLIEMGALSPHNLVFGLQLQLEQKLFDIFSWPDGDYQFNARVEAPPQAVQLDMSLASIVYEGIRRKFSDDLIKDLLEPFIDLYLGVHPDPGHRFQEIPLEADERTLVALIDGRRTMREVIEQSALPPKNARQLVYALLAAEMVQPARRPSKVAVTLEPTPKAKPPPLPAASQPPPLPKRRADAAVSAPPGPASPPPPLRRPSPGGEPALAAADLTDVVGIEELRARLVERARLLKRQNHFEALGVSQRAGVDEIQRAYFALARELHPDRLRRAADGAVPADARALAEQINHQLTTAFETLSDERRRADYKTRLEQGQRTAVSDDLNKLLGAETRFRKGEAALDAGHYKDAARHFSDAVGLYPDEGEFQASLAWALYQQAPDDPVVQADAIGRLQHAVDLAPRWDRGWLWLGRVLQRAGRPGEALKQFERALHCNPDNREAQAELKLGR
jgi:DNA-binding response OmpR family regulator/tetratricopeptide (TPR) repeat protein